MRIAPRTVTFGAATVAVVMSFAAGAYLAVSYRNAPGLALGIGGAAAVETSADAKNGTAAATDSVELSDTQLGSVKVETAGLRDFPIEKVAIGSIDYGAGEKGHFVYIKSSLTGGENDYVRDYARRHDSFPHETTGDQFFSEEQFEVYRALGFHMAHGFLSGQCKVVTSPRTGPSSVKFAAGGTDSIDAVRAALGLL